MSATEPRPWPVSVVPQVMSMGLSTKSTGHCRPLTGRALDRDLCHRAPRPNPARWPGRPAPRPPDPARPPEPLEGVRDRVRRHAAAGIADGRAVTPPAISRDRVTVTRSARQACGAARSSTRLAITWCMRGGSSSSSRQICRSATTLQPTSAAVRLGLEARDDLLRDRRHVGRLAVKGAAARSSASDMRACRSSISRAELPSLRLDAFEVLADPLG